MLLVVADTGPIRYLVQIGQIDLLPQLFEKILAPAVVAAELTHRSAPAAVQAWMKSIPPWVEILSAKEVDDPMLRALDAGERAAIELGLAVKADLVLIDDRRGATIALQKGFETTGTLGVLDIAAARGLIDLSDALHRLKDTNFRYRPEMLDALLKKHLHAGR